MAVDTGGHSSAACPAAVDSCGCLGGPGPGQGSPAGRAVRPVPYTRAARQAQEAQGGEKAPEAQKAQEGKAPQGGRAGEGNPLLRPGGPAGRPGHGAPGPGQGPAPPWPGDSNQASAAVPGPGRAGGPRRRGGDLWKAPGRRLDRDAPAGAAAGHPGPVHPHRRGLSGEGHGGGGGGGDHPSDRDAAGHGLRRGFPGAGVVPALAEAVQDPAAEAGEKAP